MKKLLLLISTSIMLFAANPIAVMKTTQGTIEIELRADLAPLAVENFVTHSKAGYYDGLIFHRILKNFMIQGGDPTGTGRGGESICGKKFKDGFSPNAVFDKPGILAMANAGRNTNGSQFFITTVPTYWLNGKHTIFGYVTKGMKIVKKLENVRANRQGKPEINQKIIKITIK